MRFITTRLAIAVHVFVFLATIMHAQQAPNGSIVGVITDSTGAVVPGVAVRATKLDTNVTVTATSNESGNYEILYLLPGEYRVTAETTGFKRWARSNIDLRAGDRIRIDVSLELGDVAETVEVTAQAPVLESTTATMSQVITSRQISNLPLKNGSLAWVYAMAPGVLLEALPYDGPWNTNQASRVSVAGGGARSADFNMDGVNNNSYGGRTTFVPPPDMVEEVRIQTTTYDAAIGHTTGGAINITTKSGTNELHGTLGASLSTGPMMTRNFFTNKFIFDPNTGPITDEKIKANTPSVRWWRYTAAVGGPVFIPKIYNGRNKTFWMFGYQGHNRSRPVAGFDSVPTSAQRRGDFGALLSLGSQYQIYDPMTTVQQGSRYARQPLPGNIIPPSRQDPAALHILSYYPESNTSGTADFLNNYAWTRKDTQVLKAPMARLDHNFSESHRMFIRYAFSDFTGHFDKSVPHSIVRGRTQRRPHTGLAVDNVFVLSPQTVLDIRYGFTWFEQGQTFDNQGMDLSEFGFPESLLNELDPRGIAFPEIRTADLLRLGNDGGYERSIPSHSLLGVVNWMKGNHSIKFGSDFRILFKNNKIFGNVVPRLDFNETYTRGPRDNSPAAPTGQGTASLLFGIPSGGYADYNDSGAEASRFFALFAQDDWRINRKLTLNLGLRWEYETPPTERYNRSVRDFDFETPNPIQEQAQARYATAPIPETPVSQFRTLGGVTFVGVGGNPRGIRNPDYRAFMPRFGFAYQLGPKTVFRGGYGLFFGLLEAGTTDIDQTGFNRRTNVVPSLDGGITYVASISNPLPDGLEKPLGAKGGLTTFLGQAPGFISADGRRPYTQRWSAGIQYQPWEGSVIEIGYTGTKTVRQRVVTQFNPVPREYLSTSPVRDQEVINFLTGKVANPFRGIDGFAGSSLYGSSKISRSQLLRPYPHFGNLSTGLPAGSSWYNAMLIRFERRFSNGLLLQANYTWSKTLEALSYLNETDRAPEHVVSNLDRPHRFVVNAVYQLPFGAGKRFLNGGTGALDLILADWEIAAIFNAQSGPPLAFGNVIYEGKFTDLRLSGTEQSLDRWFNTDGFERNSKMQLANNVRTFPSRISGVRADGLNLWDFALYKTFKIGEAFKLQLRGEAEGAMNHPNFSAPNTTPKSSLFGKVTRTQTRQEERRIFVGLKFIF